MLTTFKTRGTRIEVDLPTLFSEEFIEVKSDLWGAYLSGIGKEGFVTSNFHTILARIVEFVQPVLDAITSVNQFDKRWDPENGWG
jgi:hypothetical protein